MVVAVVRIGLVRVGVDCVSVRMLVDMAQPVSLAFGVIVLVMLVVVAVTVDVRQPSVMVFMPVLLATEQ